MEHLALKIRKNFKRYTRALAIGSGVIVVLTVAFLTLFHIFERITYDSITDLNRDFTIQIDSLTETINSSIVNYGMQIFYSDSAKTLMGAAPFSNTERVYMVRNLNTSLSSTDFAESILIHNGYSGRVYSTDPSFPDQPIDGFNREAIKKLFLERSNDLRFKPIYCCDDTPAGKEYYAFMFFEQTPDGTPKPGTLIITIKSDWYKKALLAANPSSDLIVIDNTGSILVSANDALRTEYLEYYPQISDAKNSGYITSANKKDICMYYESPVTGHTYMKISSIAKTLPRLLYFRKIVIYLLAALISLFGAALAVLLFFALLPMLRMKNALRIIDDLQTGAETGEPASTAIPATAIPSKEQIDAVVSRSERASLEQIFYDMLATKTEPVPERLLKNTGGPYGLMLIHARHRKDIYHIMEKTHPEVLVTKSSHIYACLGVYGSEEEYTACCRQIADALGCRCFVSRLFTDFPELPGHFSGLNELRRLGLLIPEETLIVHEDELNKKISVNTVSTRDFTDLIVRMKSGNLDAVRAKWQELLTTISCYRYDEFQYILYRTEDTICKVLQEFSSGLLDNGRRLLPESPELIHNIDEVNTAFDRAFIAICENYSEKKAEKYSELAEQIKKLVQDNYHDTSLNSQNIADQIHMNNAYLGRMFKNSYGRSINDYINTCRIEEARTLLRETDLPVEDIAQKVGFANIKYFYVLFKKHTGVTPAKYRTGDV